MESPLGRRITPRARNVFQVLTAAATGLTAFGALTGTGLVTGQIAAAFDRQAARKPVAPVQHPAQVVVAKRRPYRTVVRTVVVNRASAAPVASPGSGGSLRTGYSSSSRTSYHAPSTGTSRPPAAPHPAPAPAPAPSSGS